MQSEIQPGGRVGGLASLCAGGMLAGLTVITLFMTIRSSSHLSEITWLPAWIGDWADRNPDARTAVPFFLLALIYPGTLPRVRRPRANRRMLRWLAANSRWLVAGYVGITLLLLGSECAQYFIETRVLSILDLVWGLVGLAAGAVCGIWVWLQLTRFIARLVPRES